MSSSANVASSVLSSPSPRQAKSPDEVDPSQANPAAATSAAAALMNDSEVVAAAAAADAEGRGRLRSGGGVGGFVRRVPNLHRELVQQVGAEHD